MRIRAAIAASALATTIVLGGASAALAGGKHHHDHYGKGWFGGCSLSAAVLEGNPIFSEGCGKGGYEHGRMHHHRR
ncbi:hypothetical protein MUU72_29245 [Streptomyces sp. RS10V-4]|uniref:hypothetical protein n=1 Tax=Streptomyces rhizoryzae TaxID=2932493 RepID=UPI002005139B|nr:hypothetical protein [Streptomyces rhizoryzae]MCK7627133.1 hypothetical protein [Streptomyces rhizoryzae]